MAELVIAYHVGPDLVAVHAVGIVDQVRGVAAGGAHVHFQRNVIALLAKALFVLVQAEKLAVEKAALCAECLDGAKPDIPQLLRHGFLRPVGKIAQRVHNVDHGGGEYVGGVEQRYTAAVGYAVKAHNGAVDEFFHNIGSIRQFRIERFQFGIVF